MISLIRKVEAEDLEGRQTVSSEQNIGVRKGVNAKKKGTNMRKAGQSRSLVEFYYISVVETLPLKPKQVLL